MRIVKLALMLILSFATLGIRLAEAMNNGPAISFGVYDHINKRKYMEDFHYSETQGDKFYLGIFDGHGGSDVSKFLTSPDKGLHKTIFEQIGKTPDILLALKNAYIEKDHALRTEMTSIEMIGSTAVTALISNGTLYMANAGDSEACVVIDNGAGIETIALTYAHKASDENEEARVYAAGCFIHNKRVGACLAITRAFGDLNFKRYIGVQNSNRPVFQQDVVIADPYTHSLLLEPMHKYVIMASDGLWDVMSHQEAAIFVTNAAAQDEQLNPNELAKKLGEKAQSLHSEDNITVAIIKLQ